MLWTSQTVGIVDHMCGVAGTDNEEAINDRDVDRYSALIMSRLPYALFDGMR